MTLPEIRERFYKFVEQPKSSSEVADFYESEFSKLIEGVRGEIEKGKQEHGPYWDSNEKDLKCNSEYEMCEIKAYNKALDTALQILTKVISKEK
jgi:hypothetical protein